MGKEIEDLVRDHKSQHDSISELPLVTESATVTEVVTMDDDRSGEAEEGIRRILEDTGVNPPTDDYDAVRNAVEEAPAEVARRVETVVGRAERPHPMLVRARILAEEEFDLLAGQYVGMRYKGISRAYSVANSPNDDEIEICVRRVPDGRLSPLICEEMKVGDEVTVRGPYGELVLEEASPRDMVFLATGTGVAPLKGMIDYVFEEGLDVYEGEERDVWLFLGAAWLDDLPYHDDFVELEAEHGNFHYVPTLSREAHLTDWEGETEYVQHVFLKHIDSSAVRKAIDETVEESLVSKPVSGTEERIDPGGIEAYACGINAMVFALVNAAESVGVPDERIESEGFG